MTAEPAFVVPPLAGAPPRTPPGPVRELAGEALGTSWRLLWAGPELPASAVDAALDAVAAEMSAWRPDSALSRFNAAPAGAWVPLPVGLLDVLRCGLAVAEASDGAFDPTMGAAAEAWGFGPSGPRAAPPAHAPAPLGWRRLRIDAGGRAFQPGGLSLDVGGIGKGWAADMLARLLDRRGASSHLVEVGGEVVGRGLKPDGAPWTVALEPPRPGAPCPAVVALHTGALATSGDHRRGFAHDGRRYAHTLDPRTGAPLAAPPASVTVWAPACTEADAWATALTVLGREAGVALADREGVAALITEPSAEGFVSVPTAAWAAMAEP